MKWTIFKMVCLGLNEMSKPPQEEMSNVEATMTEQRRVQDELATSQAQFMKKVHTPSQEE